MSQPGSVCALAVLLRCLSSAAVLLFVRLFDRCVLHIRKREALASAWYQILLPEASYRRGFGLAL